MPKADLVLPDGTKVTIDGGRDEIQRLIEKLTEAPASSPKAKRRPDSHSIKGRIGPTERVRKLEEEGFFREKRSLLSLLKKLEEKGHIYEMDDLSPVLIRLTRAGELRRVKEKGEWAYVNP